MRKQDVQGAHCGKEPNYCMNKLAFGKIPAEIFTVSPFQEHCLHQLLPKNSYMPFMEPLHIALRLHEIQSEAPCAHHKWLRIICFLPSLPHPLFKSGLDWLIPVPSSVGSATLCACSGSRDLPGVLYMHWRCSPRLLLRVKGLWILKSLRTAVLELTCRVHR